MLSVYINFEIMSKEEKIKALESLLKWLENGGKLMIDLHYFGMCSWVRIYLEDKDMSDIETEQYLLSLGLNPPANRLIHHWFPAYYPIERIDLVKQTIENLKSES